MPFIEVSALDRQQMDGNRVAVECIDRENVEVLVITCGKFSFQEDPGIPDHDINGCLGIREIGERTLRDSQHIRIDLVESEVVAFPSECRQGPDTKTDDADSQVMCAVFFGKLASDANGLTDTALRSVISRGLAFSIIVQELQSVHYLSMIKCIGWRSADFPFGSICPASVSHRQHTVEIS